MADSIQELQVQAAQRQQDLAAQQQAVASARAAQQTQQALRQVQNIQQLQQKQQFTAKLGEASGKIKTQQENIAQYQTELVQAVKSQRLADVKRGGQIDAVKAAAEMRGFKEPAPGAFTGEEYQVYKQAFDKAYTEASQSRGFTAPGYVTDPLSGEISKGLIQQIQKPFGTFTGQVEVSQSGKPQQLQVFQRGSMIGTLAAQTPNQVGAIGNTIYPNLYLTAKAGELTDLYGRRFQIENDRLNNAARNGLAAGQSVGISNTGFIDKVNTNILKSPTGLTDTLKAAATSYINFFKTPAVAALQVAKEAVKEGTNLFFPSVIAPSVIQQRQFERLQKALPEGNVKQFVERKPTPSEYVIAGLTPLAFSSGSSPVLSSILAGTGIAATEIQGIRFFQNPTPQTLGSALGTAGAIGTIYGGMKGYQYLTKPYPQKIEVKYPLLEDKRYQQMTGRLPPEAPASRNVATIDVIQKGQQRGEIFQVLSEQPRETLYFSTKLRDLFRLAPNKEVVLYPARDTLFAGKTLTPSEETGTFAGKYIEQKATKYSTLQKFNEIKGKALGLKDLPSTYEGFKELPKLDRQNLIGLAKAFVGKTKITEEQAYNVLVKQVPYSTSRFFIQKGSEVQGGPLRLIRQSSGGTELFLPSGPVTEESVIKAAGLGRAVPIDKLSTPEQQVFLFESSIKASKTNFPRGQATDVYRGRAYFKTLETPEVNYFESNAPKVSKPSVSPATEQLQIIPKQVATTIQAQEQIAKIASRLPPIPKSPLVMTQQAKTELLGIGLPKMVGGQGLSLLGIEFAATGQYEKTEGGLLPQQKQVPKESQVPRLISTPKLTQPQPQIISQAPKQISPLIETPTLAQPQIISPIAALQPQISQPIQPRPQVTDLIRPISKVIPIEILSDLETKKKKRAEALKAFGKAYSVFIRRRGKEIEIGKNLPERRALKLGAERVMQTLAASFRVRAAGTTTLPDIDFTPSGSVFRQGKKDASWFVQKSGSRKEPTIKGARLSSMGEKAEIRLFNKRKKIKNTFF